MEGQQAIDTIRAGSKVTGPNGARWGEVISIDENGIAFVQFNHGGMMTFGNHPVSDLKLVIENVEPSIVIELHRPADGPIFAHVVDAAIKLSNE